MDELLKLAIADRKECLRKLKALDLIIKSLGGDVPKTKTRKHNAATKKKMREAWAKRKLNKTPPHDDKPKYGLEEP